MEELLGHYNMLDKPDGLQERMRIPVDDLRSFDISVRHLHFKHILHDICIDIPEGSFVTIKGASGIGKTTFLRHLVGLYNAPEGTVQ